MAFKRPQNDGRGLRSAEKQAWRAEQAGLWACGGCTRVDLPPYTSVDTLVCARHLRMGVTPEWSTRVSRECGCPAQSPQVSVDPLTDTTQAFDMVLAEKNKMKDTRGHRHGTRDQDDGEFWAELREFLQSN
ncbi:hypothetical protein BDZ89DRAFT_1248335 [Hymenopellis radicata]|nr:hypothetical protein BDZ89DRAFT_1248335 [Hymenopellis radicata]